MSDIESLIKRVGAIAGLGGIAYALNSLVVAGTDARLGTAYRPAVLGVTQIPLFELVIDSVDVIRTALRENFLLVPLFGTLLLAVVLYRIRAPIGWQRISDTTKKLRRPALAGLIGASAFGALRLELPATEIRGHLTTVSAFERGGLSTRAKLLSTERLCTVLSDSASRAGIGLDDCPSAGSAVEGRNNPYRRGWFARILVLSMIAAIGFLSAPSWSDSKDGPWKLAMVNGAVTVLAIMTLLAVAGIPYAYGSVVRTLRPAFIDVTTASPYLTCSGFFLSAEGGNVTIYNPNGQTVETFRNTVKIETAPPRGANHDFDKEYVVAAITRNPVQILGEVCKVAAPDSADTVKVQDSARQHQAQEVKK